LHAEDLVARLRLAVGLEEIDLQAQQGEG